MKSFPYIWRMALRRKAVCLLVILSAMAATVFMLFYPSLIANVQNELEETYDGITVTGSILTAGIGNDPAISNDVWKEMQASGHFSELYANSRFSVRTIPRGLLEEQAGTDTSEQEQLTAFQTLLPKFEAEDSGCVGGRMRAYNTFRAADELVRIRDSIRWMDGYDESCMEGNERICIISEKWGYHPGDTVPFLAEVVVYKRPMKGIFRLKVAGTYPGKITEFAGVMPLKTMEELTVAANAAQKQHGNSYNWSFSIDEVYFTVKDNRQLNEIKTMITERGLRGSDTLRVRIDDRILKETVGPIESNLAQLEGSYLFFFLMIAVLGAFISFLLARDRKPEYAVMGMLGESRIQITLKALLEQFILCLAGVVLGVAAGHFIDVVRFDKGICAMILFCYTLGAAAAVMLTVRVNVMDILRDKE